MHGEENRVDRQTMSTILWETKVKTTVSKPLTGIIQILAFAVCLVLPQFEALFHVLSEAMGWLYMLVLEPILFELYVAVQCTREQVRLPVIFANDPFHGETSSGTDVFVEKEKQNFLC